MQIDLTLKRTETYFKYVYIVLLLIVIIVQGIIPITGNNIFIHSWSSEPILFSVTYIVAFVWALYVYVIFFGNVIWACIIGIVMLNKAVNFLSRLPFFNPLSPKRDHGLDFVTDYALSLIRLVSIGLIFVVSWTIFVGIDIRGLILLFSYSLFIMFVLYSITRNAYKIVNHAKEQQLSLLADKFAEPYKKFLYSDADPSRGERVNIEQLAAIAALCDKVERMPVRIFQPHLFVRVGALLTAPLVVAALQAFTQNAVTSFIGKILVKP